MNPSPSMSAAKKSELGRPAHRLAVSEAALAVTDVEHHAALLLAADPIDLAVAVQIEHGLLARGVGVAGDAGGDKTDLARPGLIEPPLPPAVLIGHGQVELAVLVDVISHVDFALKRLVASQAEVAFAVVERHRRATHGRGR